MSAELSSSETLRNTPPPIELRNFITRFRAPLLGVVLAAGLFLGFSREANAQYSNCAWVGNGEGLLCDNVLTGGRSIFVQQGGSFVPIPYGTEVSTFGRTSPPNPTSPTRGYFTSQPDGLGGVVNRAGVYGTGGNVATIECNAYRRNYWAEVCR